MIGDTSDHLKILYKPEPLRPRNLLKLSLERSLFLKIISHGSLFLHSSYNNRC